MNNLGTWTFRVRALVLNFTPNEASMRDTTNREQGRRLFPPNVESVIPDIQDPHILNLWPKILSLTISDPESRTKRYSLEAFLTRAYHRDP